VKDAATRELNARRVDEVASRCWASARSLVARPSSSQRYRVWTLELRFVFSNTLFVCFTSCR